MTEEHKLLGLLPCPFCGSSVDWCNCSEEGCHQITCRNCGNFDFANGVLDGDDETLEKLRACMVDKWNTRRK